MRSKLSNVFTKKGAPREIENQKMRRACLERKELRYVREVRW